jgi:hypothetical protein
MAISNVGNEIIKWFMPTKLFVKEVKSTPIDKFDLFSMDTNFESF